MDCVGRAGQRAAAARPPAPDVSHPGGESNDLRPSIIRGGRSQPSGRGGDPRAGVRYERSGGSSGRTMLLGGERGRLRVRIVVGEGRSARMGFLRFVLGSEGYEVVAQASSASELARVLAVHQPDVVVLDDGIGATAVQMTHEVSPNAKVILVWPGAVVPIGGDAPVDPGPGVRPA